MFMVIQKQRIECDSDVFVWTGFKDLKSAKEFVENKIKEIKEQFGAYEDTEEDFEKYKKDNEEFFGKDLSEEDIKEIRDEFKDEVVEIVRSDTKFSIDLLDTNDYKSDFLIVKVDCEDKTKENFYYL